MATLSSLSGYISQYLLALWCFMLHTRIELVPLPMRLLSSRSYLNVCSTSVNKCAPYTNEAQVVHHSPFSLCHLNQETAPILPDQLIKRWIWDSTFWFAYNVAPLWTTECFSITFNAFFRCPPGAGTSSPWPVWDWSMVLSEGLEPSHHNGNRFWVCRVCRFHHDSRLSPE